MKRKLIKKKVSKSKKRTSIKKTVKKTKAITKKKKLVKKKVTPRKSVTKKKPKISYLNPSQLSYWIETLKLRSSNFQDDVLIIPKKTKIVGNLINKKTIIVFGEVDGEIQSSNIIIAPSSKCTGAINGETVTILGNVQSEITVKNQCFIKKSAIIKGDIYYNETINIESGAKILGSLYPKKRPLALPNYTKSVVQNNSNVIDLRMSEMEQPASPTNSSLSQNQNLQSKTKGALDKIINKIFS
jgi:cytoskeletal protein CcmA (bactofilin family)